MKSEGRSIENIQTEIKEKKMNREYEKVYETYGMVSISNTKLKYIQK